jgi:serine/threonine-protein kinase
MPTTDLDDLKIAWNELNRQLERQNALTLRQMKESKLGRFRSGLRPLVFGQILQLLLGAVITIVSANFWVSHLNQPHLVLSGLFLQAYGILFIAFAVQDLILIRRIDYSAPIVVIQRQLAELGTWHIRTAIWYGVAGSVVWLPVLIIILHLLGADIWIQKPRAVWWLLASAFVCLAFNYSLVLLARTPGKCGRALAGSWIGRSVNRAQVTLNEIEEFERERA